jgi:hypothetical protein
MHEHDDSQTGHRRAIARAMVDVNTPDIRHVLGKYAVDEQTLAQWLSEPSFRRTLRRVRKALSTRRELRVARGAEKAAECLEDALAPDALPRGLSDLQRKVCVDLIRLARATPAKPRTAATATEPLISPDIPQEEAQRLLREMNGEEKRNT